MTFKFYFKFLLKIFIYFCYFLLKKFLINLEKNLILNYLKKIYYE